MKKLLNLNRYPNNNKDCGYNMELPNSNIKTPEKSSHDNVMHSNLKLSSCVDSEVFGLTCTSHFKGWSQNQSCFTVTQICKQPYYDNALLIICAIQRTLYEWIQIDQIIQFSKSAPSSADRFVSTMCTNSVCPGFLGYSFWETVITSVHFACNCNFGITINLLVFVLIYNNIIMCAVIQMFLLRFHDFCMI